MNDLLQQVEIAIKAKLFYLALFTTLCIPDICGAMEAEDGNANKDRYIKWYNRYISADCVLSAEDCYYFRCSLLHQGKGEHPTSAYTRYLFTEVKFMNNNFFKSKTDVKMSLNIDLNDFCLEILKGAKKWLLDVQNTATYKKNHDLMLKRYPNGFPPYIVGIPVIA